MVLLKEEVLSSAGPIHKETIVQTEFASKDKLCSYVTNEVIYTYLSILMCGIEKNENGYF